MRRRIIFVVLKIHRHAAPRERAAGSCCCFGGLGLRHRPLALGNAQRYQTSNSRECTHVHLKGVGGALNPPLCRGLCLRRRPPALPPPYARLSLSLSLSLCYSHTYQHSAITIRRRILLPYLNEHSEQTRAPHTNGPRDVPRCGALSLLQMALRTRFNSKTKRNRSQ